MMPSRMKANASQDCGQRTNGDLRTLGGAQVLDGGVHIIDRQTDMLQPVMGKGGAGAFGSCRGCGMANYCVMDRRR